MTTPHRQRATEAFYGRRKGKTLKPAQARALETAASELKLDLANPAPDQLVELFAHGPEKIIMEIGFGGGEHLAHHALSKPKTGFIGVEPFINSYAKLAARITNESIANIRLYDDDAVQVLDWLPDASLDGIDLFYPDPWPKKKHWKRRFVNEVNLDRFARVLKKGGIFRFASDIDTYVNWTLQHIAARQDFEWTAKCASDWQTPYEGWTRTRYEAKAFREGRTPAYLTFERL